MYNLRMKRWMWTLLFVVFLCTFAFSQDQPFVGDWYGAINLPAVDMDVSVTLREEDGALSGTIDIPSQQIKAMPLQVVQNDKEKISFTIPKMTGHPTFTGTLSENGHYMYGEFSQGSGRFRFRLTRTH